MAIRLSVPKRLLTLAAAVSFCMTGLAAAAPDAGPLVSSAWLAKHLERDDVVILDIRSPLAKKSRKDYEAGHIPGALYSEYPGAWRTTRNKVSGVLPSVEKLEAYLSELGISEDKRVVIVSDGSSSLDFGAAARIYWTLKTLGHKPVSILNGGYKDWVADASRPVQKGTITPEGDFFEADFKPSLVISTDKVAAIVKAAGKDKTLLLDARPLSYFKGKERHPDAKKFGRLPEAKNLDQATFFLANSSKLKATATLQTLVSSVVKSKDAKVVSYCNTGHWAATNWFVMTELLGHKNVTVYDASMVGWTQNDALPIKSERKRIDDLKDWFSRIMG